VREFLTTQLQHRPSKKKQQGHVQDVAKAVQATEPATSKPARPPGDSEIPPVVIANTGWDTRLNRPPAHTPRGAATRNPKEGYRGKQGVFTCVRILMQTYLRLPPAF